MIKPLKQTLVAAALAAAAFAAQAAAPMVKTPAPGFYRVMVGDIEVTPISDGTFDLPMDQYMRQKPELTRTALAKHFLKLPVETSDNAFLSTPAASWCWSTRAPARCSAPPSASSSTT
jgi:hypothetical protein